MDICGRSINMLHKKLLLQLIINCHFIITCFPNVLSSEIQRNQTAYVGTNVTLSCNSTTDLEVNWYFKHKTKDLMKLCDKGHIRRDLKDKYGLVKHVSHMNDLVILNVSQADSGVYQCVDEEGLGSSQYTELSVSTEPLATTYEAFSSSSEITATTSTTKSLTKLLNQTEQTTVDTTSSIQCNSRCTSWIINILTVLSAIIMLMA